ncbi:hypothetical protein C3L33_02986, partial [Rhododendron williamsianum]
MKGGRKNLKRAAGEETFTLQQGQSIVQVVSLRGSNLIEVMDAKGENALALFPAKFQKSMWIKRGSFVVVDESGREEAIDSGRKVACIVSQVLFHEQLRFLQKSPEWPENFKSSIIDNSWGKVEGDASTQDETELKLSDDGGELTTTDDDELPPIEANTNRRKPSELQSDTEISERPMAQSMDLLLVSMCDVETADSMANFPKLVEDIIQTSINTGPRGAVRLAQGVQAVIGVGSEWLADVSKLTSFIASAPTLFPPEYVQEFQNCFDRAPAVPFEEIQKILREELGRPIESVYEYVDPTPIASASIAQVHGAKLRGSQEDVVIKVLKPGIEDILVADLNFVYVVARILEFLNPELNRASLCLPKSEIRDAEFQPFPLFKAYRHEAVILDSGHMYRTTLGALFMAQKILCVLKSYFTGSWSEPCLMLNYVGIVKDIKESMLEEVDFNKEAMNIESFRRYLESMGFTRQATAPKVYPQCSSQRILTMERLYGVPLTDLDSISSLVSSPETSLITALNVWFGSLLACESFHADVHAGNLWLLRDGRIGFLDFGIVGRISPKTWAAMEVFLASITTEEYESMASALIEMGATNKDVDSKAFARDLEKIFSSIQDLDTEIVVATARETNTNATAVSANLVVDERQMNALFLDVVQVSESYGLRFPREFALLMKQLLYFDRYTRLLAPNLNMLQDQRISIVSNRRSSNRNIYQ